MFNYFRSNIQAMSGYVPGEQPGDDGIIKLNTNENPYPPSPKVIAALRKAINASLRLYPQPTSDKLCAAAAAAYGIKKENIIAGNGSDELLSIILRCFINTGDRIAYPVPTYSLYDTLVEIQAGVAVRVPFPENFTLPEELARRDTALTILCNPNAPSGTLVSLPEIVRLAQAVAGILVVDEAYVDFASSEGASAIPLISRLPNLIVLRSLSKSFSLAGMRIGLGFASPEIIAGMHKVRDSYNLDRLSIVAGAAALEDLAWMKRNAGRIQRSRQRLANGLKRLGYQVYPSQSNFILARQRDKDLQLVYQELKRRKILVRYFDMPDLRDCMRITVGTPKEIQALLNELATISV
jgi:histidinol-phosphate aminotransferase